MRKLPNQAVRLFLRWKDAESAPPRPSSTDPPPTSADQRFWRLVKGEGSCAVYAHRQTGQTANLLRRMNFHEFNGGDDASDVHGRNDAIGNRNPGHHGFPVACAKLPVALGRAQPYYKAAGYCFKTPRGINYFGNAGCRFDSENAVPLSRSAREPHRRNRAAGAAARVQLTAVLPRRPRGRHGGLDPRMDLLGVSYWERMMDPRVDTCEMLLARV